VTTLLTSKTGNRLSIKSLLTLYIFLFSNLTNFYSPTEKGNRRNCIIGYSNNLFRGFNVNDAKVAASLMQVAITKDNRLKLSSNTIVIKSLYRS